MPKMRRELVLRTTVLTDKTPCGVNLVATHYPKTTKKFERNLINRIHKKATKMGSRLLVAEHEFYWPEAGIRVMPCICPVNDTQGAVVIKCQSMLSDLISSEYYREWVDGELITRTFEIN